MALLHTVSDEEATGKVREVFDDIGDKQGVEETEEIADKAEKAAKRVRSLLDSTDNG